MSMTAADQGYPLPVQLAGLAHAAYGTNGFDVALLELAGAQGRPPAHLAGHQVPIEQGSVASAYLRDPDGNLVEISTYQDAEHSLVK